MQDKVTQYGFTWGPIEVQRLAHDKTFRALSVVTPFVEVQVVVSPTGRKVHVVQTRRRAVRAGGAE